MSLQELWSVSVGTPTHHGVDRCCQPFAEPRDLGLTRAYLIVLERKSASLAYLRLAHRSVGKASGDAASASLRWLRAKFAKQYGELCSQLCLLKFAGWDDKSCH